VTQEARGNERERRNGDGGRSFQGGDCPEGRRDQVCSNLTSRLAILRFGFETWLAVGCVATRQSRTRTIRNRPLLAPRSRLLAPELITDSLNTDYLKPSRPHRGSTASANEDI